MEVLDATKILLNRIQKFETDHAQKIIGCLLLHHSPEEISEFALASDKDIALLINEAKSVLASSGNYNASWLAQQQQQQQQHRVASRPASLPMSLRVVAPFFHPQLSTDQVPLGHNLDHHPPVPYNRWLREQPTDYDEQLHPLLSPSHSLPNKYYFSELAFAEDFGSRINLRPRAGLSELPNKQCHYFMKGYCKNGSNCRFIHGQDINDSYYDEDHSFSQGSLENLEIEIVELLKSKGGIPISIAALPMLYHEKYGKALQSDGYLTESQRHGKPGFSLTRLLARFKNTIRIIERPHGQHSVILAEDALRYMVHKNERIDQGSPNGSSHQIYLTFPADSSFTEDDVRHYFNQYGPVHDVRIPRQTQRMFGFVSFLHPETVRLVLSKGHPHYICGARVLVKPYKEKSKDKKYTDVVEPPVFFPHYLDTHLDPDAMLLVRDNLGFMRRQQIEDYSDLATELERKQLLDMQLASKQLAPGPYIRFGTRRLQLPEVIDDFNMLAVSQNDPKADRTARQTSEDSSDHNSDAIQLPDSPFAN